MRDQLKRLFAPALLSALLTACGVPAIVNSECRKTLDTCTDHCEDQCEQGPGRQSGDPMRSLDENLTDFNHQRCADCVAACRVQAERCDNNHRK